MLFSPYLFLTFPVPYPISSNYLFTLCLIFSPKKLLHGYKLCFASQGRRFALRTLFFSTIIICIGGHGSACLLAKTDWRLPALPCLVPMDGWMDA
jgi:hypothetical protein